MSLNFSSSDRDVIEKEVKIEASLSKLSDIWTANDLNRCIKFIREKFLTRVCLQFSDDIIKYATEIELHIRKHIDSNIFILADTSYGSCCVDEVSSGKKTSYNIQL
jgi:diphthamide biosynthesis protein 2